MLPAELELLIRGCAVGTYLALAVALLRAPRGPARVSGILLCLAAAAHTMTQAPEWEDLLGGLAPLVWALSVAGAGLLWLFAVELLGDLNLPSPARLAPAAFLLLIGIAALAAPPELAPLIWLLHKAVGAALLLHALLIIWREWSNDLVEQRRHLRGPIMAAVASYGIVYLAAEAAWLAGVPAKELAPLATLALLALGLAALGAFVRTDPALFARPAPIGPGGVEPVLTPKELQAIKQLEALMTVERIYRDNTLTFGALTARIGLPEHGLRRLINRTLGFSNFSSYLNKWRLTDVCAALSDPAQYGVPILTIALDAGFGSVGPFNRAFKQATGVTPTVYRERNASVGLPVFETD